MELLKQALLGQHTIQMWIAGMLWAFIGIIAVKLWYLNSNVKFSLKYWLNDNSIDVGKGLLWALVILRLGDYVIHLLEDKFGFTMPKTDDFVIIMIVISGFIQYRLHKNRKPISENIKAEMHQHNNNCKH